MITFKPITIEDKAEIESFTLPYAPANCNLAFANMFCWQFQFKTAWSVVDGFLVIRFQIGGSDRIGYMQPVGAGDSPPSCGIWRRIYSLPDNGFGSST